MSDVTLDELERRLGEEGLVLVDVRSHDEFMGHAGYPCDARQGHIPGSRHIDLQVLMLLPDGETIREYVGAPEGAARRPEQRSSPPQRHPQIVDRFGLVAAADVIGVGADGLGQRGQE